MILQSLLQYYHHQVTTDHPNYAPSGMELKRIHFVLVLNGDGILIDIEQPNQKVFVAKSRPRCGKDAVMIANRMWDSVGYVTGYGADNQKHRTDIQYRSFTEQALELSKTYPKNKSFAAVVSFYSKYRDQLHKHELWQTIVSKTGHNLTFRLLGESLLASQQLELLQENVSGSTHRGYCLVSGQKRAIALLHPKIYITGGSAVGAKLVSFTKGSGYESYGKKGGENAPVSVEITESYAAALTGLLQQDSGNNVVVGNVSFIFYTLPNSNFNEIFGTLTNSSGKGSKTEALEALKSYLSSEDEFVMMAFVPNAARISVRLFIQISVREAAQNIIRFYDEITLKHNFNISDTIALFTPMFIISPHQNIKKLSSQLIVEYFSAVIRGTPFPAQLQLILLNKQREQKNENMAIVSMLRCYLNRANNNHKTDLSMALNKSNHNCGYLLGRMFAILERSQELSNPGIAFTLRDTYYTTASVTPSAVFNRLVGLSTSFFRKIPSPATTIYMKTQLGEVIELLDATGIPMRLSLDDQSRFALGYFHQRQTYFTKRKTDE